MLGSLLLLSAFGLTADNAPGHDPSKGASLLSGCQAQVRLMALPTLDEAPQMDLINGAYCIGYLNGFAAALPAGSAAICTHQDSMANMVRAYVNFMEQNPPLLEEDKRVGLRRALEAAYPCPATH